MPCDVLQKIYWTQFGLLLSIKHTNVTFLVSNNCSIAQFHKKTCSKQNSVEKNAEEE